MSIWIRIWLTKIGLYSFPVDLLHKSYLSGGIGLSTLYELLKPNQLVEFIRHHESVKASFDRAEQLGLTKTDELHEGMQEIINNPLTQAALAMNGELTMTTKERQRMIPALNQLSGRILHGVLEREVLAHHDKKNIVIDQADYD
jgi:hypothetical protein